MLKTRIYEKYTFGKIHLLPAKPGRFAFFCCFLPTRNSRLVEISQSGLLFFPIFLFTNSTIIIFNSNIPPINNGKILKFKYDAIRPNNGGINVDPI